MLKKVPFGPAANALHELSVLDCGDNNYVT
jgi:hypothetical protein